MALDDIQPVPRNKKGIRAAIDQLRRPLGERLQTGVALREQHAHTTTYIPNQPPDAVAFADSNEDVETVVRVCAEHGAPVIAFGSGTSLEGHVNAPAGGVALNLSVV